MENLLRIISRLLIVLQLNNVISGNQVNYILDGSEGDAKPCSENKDATSTSSETDES